MAISYNEAIGINKDALEVQSEVFLAFAENLSALLPTGDYNSINLMLKNDVGVSITPNSEQIGNLTPQHRVTVIFKKAFAEGRRIAKDDAYVEIYLWQSSKPKYMIEKKDETVIYYHVSEQWRRHNEPYYPLKDLIANSLKEESQKNSRFTNDEHVVKLLEDSFQQLIEMRAQTLNKNINDVQANTATLIANAIPQGVAEATGFLSPEEAVAKNTEIDTLNNEKTRLEELVDDQELQIAALQKVQVSRKKNIMATIGTVWLLWEVAERIYKVNPEFFQALFKKANLVNPEFLSRILESLDQYLN